jgi:hypothetical protein
MSEIYTSISEDIVPNEPNYEQLRDSVSHFLTANQDTDFINALTICEEVGLPQKGTQVLLRKIIADLRDKAHPIASNPRGFMYTNNPEVLEKTIYNLDTRIMGILRARSGLTKAKNRMVNGEQTTLDLGDDE